MISYSFRIITIFIIFFFSIYLNNLSAQEDIKNIDSSPQNIVPDIPEIETNNISNSNKLNTVMVSDLPKSNPSWIGSLSFDILLYLPLT